MECTIRKYLKIVPGTIADYKHLSRFHYRHGKTGVVAAVYKCIDTHCIRRQIEAIVGIIIYTMPACAVQLRNVATRGLFTQLGSSSVNMQFVNQNIRTIARVVIEPRYRALGLAYELVKETMPLLQMPYIEALAVMGKVNPFFEKAGMMKYEAPEPLRCAKLKEALSIVGIEEYDLVDIERTHEKIENLNPKAKAFIENEIQCFLTAYGRRMKNLTHSFARTEYFINRLTDRPVYYIWRNAKLDLRFHI